MAAVTATTLLDRSPARKAHSGHRRWPLWAWFGLTPLWWLLGVFNVIWSVVAVPVLCALSRHRRLAVPRGFGIWLMFLVCVAVSAVQITSVDRFAAYVYRGSLYVSVTALFVYVYCSPRDRLGDDVIVRFVVGFWAVVAIGGLLGIGFPTLRFPSLLSLVLPGDSTSVPFVGALVSLEFAQESRILGWAVGRPVAPFAFTNAWGANFALLTPFVIAGLSVIRSRLWRLVLIALLLASVASVVLSLNRGLWLSLSVGVFYASVRLASSGRVRLLFATAFMVAVIALAIMVTPLGDVVVQRRDRGHSDAGRTSLYTQSIELARQSPIVGWGAPQPSASGDGPSVGTHGQFWLVIVSNGVPAAIALISWYLVLMWRTRHERDPVGVWLHACLLISFVQLPVYEQLPSHLHITMAAGALLMRRLSSLGAPDLPAAVHGTGVPLHAVELRSSGARA